MRISYSAYSFIQIRHAVKKQENTLKTMTIYNKKYRLWRFSFVNDAFMICRSIEIVLLIVVTKTLFQNCKTAVLIKIVARNNKLRVCVQ